MPERVLNFEITTALSVRQRDADGVSTLVDADELPTLQIVQDGVAVNTTESETVVSEETGVYTCTWTPRLIGRHVLTWTFSVGGTEFTSEEKVDIVADVGGESDSSLPAETTTPVPDLGASKTCLVVGQFYDASGNAISGIYVRFTPDRATTSFLASGIVAAEVTAESDENGAIELYLVRGTTGILAITGIGVVKRVTIPATGRIDIKDLADSGGDLFEVQAPVFYMLPRRS
jgi:hypothetical protein